MGRPDIPGYDPANKIAENNGTWTADRDGWARCSVCADQYSKNVVVLNGRNILNFDTPASNGITETIFPVKKGDVIKLSSTALIYYFGNNPFTAVQKWSGCYYIPSVNDRGTISANVCISY